jgi:DNA-directed RNA polymerase
MAIQTWWADLPNESLKETAWERQMNLAGIAEFERKRYKSNDESKEASETVSGQKMIRKLILEAEAGINRMQDEVLSGTRMSRNTRGTVLMVPAETAAMLVLKIMLDRTYSASNDLEGSNFQLICKEVAKAIELELNFRNWVKKSRETAKEVAKAEGLTKTPKSKAEWLIESEGIDRTTLWRWKQAFAELSEYSWDTLEQHYCGEALVRAVVDTLPQQFEIFVLMRGPHKELRLRMKPEFRAKFDDMEQRVANLQVVKKPMLTKPRPWRRQG